MELTLRRKPKGTAPATPAESGAATYPIPDPTKPSALLLPPFVMERVAEQRTRKAALRAIVATVAFAVLAGAGVTGWAYMAKRDLAVAQAERRAADARVEKFIDVARYYDGYTARLTTLQGLLAGDIKFSDPTEQVLALAPDNVEVTSIEYAPGVPCPGPNPFVTEATLGCVTVAGLTNDENAVAQYVDTLNKGRQQPLLADAFVNAIARDGGSQADFSLSVNYTLNSLSYKFVDQAEIPDPADQTDPDTTGGTP